MTTRAKASIMFVVYLLTIVVNTLGAMGYINDMSQKAVSDRYQTLITPAPFTFAIWGLIYLLVAALLLYLIVRAREQGVARVTDALMPLFIVSCVLEAGWIVAFSYLQIELSTLLIALLLVTLTTLCLRLRAVGHPAGQFAPLVFGIYAGWVMIATVANIALMLVKLRWDAFGIAHETWAAVILAVAVLLKLAVNARLKNAVFSLPIAWAYAGIFYIHYSTADYAGQYRIVLWVSLIGGILLLAIAVGRFLANGRAVIPEAAASR